MATSPSYNKSNWADDDPSKPLSAARMNNLETQADAAYTDAVAAAKTYTDTKTNDTGWVTTGITLGPGVTNNSTIAVRQVGNLVTVAAQQLTIDTLSVPTSGNVANQTLFTLPSQFWPTVVQGLPAGPAGPLASFYVGTGGNVGLAAIAPDATQTGTVTNTNVVVSVSGTYMVN